MKVTQFTFIGGDLRQIHAANMLSRDGYTVKIFGFDDIRNINLDDKIIMSPALLPAIGGSDVIVLPLPYTTGEGIITAPFSKDTIYISDVLNGINKNQFLFVGKIDEKIESLAQTYNIHIVDYFAREELTVLNAIPTAEGAISIALKETPVTIHGSRCLVLGHGRIGKVLAKLLKGLEADVTVMARKHSDLAWVKTLGYTPLHISELSEYVGQYDIIFNTIPEMIMQADTLSRVDSETLIIDLASKPGGGEGKFRQDFKKANINQLSMSGNLWD